MRHTTSFSFPFRAISLQLYISSYIHSVHICACLLYYTEYINTHVSVCVNIEHSINTHIARIHASRAIRKARALSEGTKEPVGCVTFTCILAMHARRMDFPVYEYMYSMYTSPINKSECDTERERACI